MKLENIGFYTLSNERALNSSVTSQLSRCELVLTDNCNFKCPYCRGLKDELKGDISFDLAMETLSLWIKDNLKNVRFSGGEPTLYSNLDLLIKYCRDNNVEHIALSTNGSAKFEYYKYLAECGVNDFSISLDSGCCSTGDKMTGGIEGAWETVVNNIKELSKLYYVTVGVVFTEDNFSDAINIVKFADSLGVSDIRVIPAAQYNKALQILSDLPKEILQKYPILKYRINRVKNDQHVRGLDKDSKTLCRLVLDDMAVVNGYHFPCIIYMREGGNPIGYVNEDMRKEREEWMKSTIPSTDKICSEMCLDVCIDFNNIASKRK